MKVVTGFGAILAAALIWFSGAASAHHVWLEPEGQGVQLSFGEFGENLRETSPGSLDRLQPQAKTATSAGEQALALTKAAAGFTGSLAAGSGNVIAEDARYPISVRTRDGVTTRSLWWPAARFVTDRTAAKPVLVLDVLPAGGDKFKVFFKGQPLAKVKVEVVAAFGWSKDAYTDADGSFEMTLPWRGLYALEVHHVDKTPGKRGEEAFDTASYVTTLTLVQGQGIDMPPRPAQVLGKPN